MNKEKLQQLSAYLRATDGDYIDPSGCRIIFNMGTLYTQTECNTTCCIAGLATLMFGDTQLFGDTQQLHSLYYEATRVLGLSAYEVGALYLPDQARLNTEAELDAWSKWRDHETGAEPLRISMIDISPQWAADCIDKFIETGTIDWLGTRPEPFLPV